MAKNREIYGDTLEYGESWKWRRMVTRMEPHRPWQVLERVHPDEWTQWEVEVHPEMWKNLYRYDLPFPVGAVERLKDWIRGLEMPMPHGVGGSLKYIRNKAIIVLTTFFIAFPLCAVVTGNRWMLDWSLLLAFLEMFYMAVFAALWISVGLVPFWLLYAAVSVLVHGGNPSNDGLAWPVCWAMAWFAYPAWRSLWHAIMWEQERKAGEPDHPLYKHPWAGVAACLGTAAAIGYIGNRKNPAQEP